MCLQKEEYSQVCLYNGTLLNNMIPKKKHEKTFYNLNIVSGTTEIAQDTQKRRHTVQRMSKTS